MVEIAIMMDIDNPEANPLQLKNCYFDAMHKHVQSFRSFGLWTFYPVMKKILHLASMEICSENSQDIVQFFSFFNEIVAKEKKILRYKFNPRCFICDGGGGYNYNAITQVYGQGFCNECIKGCQWHFKNDVIKKSTHIPMEYRDMFQDICHQLCLVTMVLKYNILKAKLDELSKLTPALEKWIEWWQLRRSHIFGPFRMLGLPGVNLAEQGNSFWKPKKPLRLVYVVPPQSWGDRSDTKHSKCLLLGGRRLNQLTLIPKPKGSGGAWAATAQVGPANKRNDTKRCLPVEASLRPGEAVPW